LDIASEILLKVNSFFRRNFLQGKKYLLIFSYGKRIEKSEFFTLKKRILRLYNACLVFLLLFTCGGVDFGEKSDALSEKYTEKANIPYE